MANENLLETLKYKDIDVSFLAEKETGFEATKEELKIITNCAKLGKAYYEGTLYVFDTVIVEDVYITLQANGLYIVVNEAILTVEFDTDSYVLYASLPKKAIIYKSWFTVDGKTIVVLTASNTKANYSASEFERLLATAIDAKFEVGAHTTAKIIASDYSSSKLYLFVVDTDTAINTIEHTGDVARQNVATINLTLEV